jgi:hypothetical protein
MTEVNADHFGEPEAVERITNIIARKSNVLASFSDSSYFQSTLVRFD